MEKGKQARGMVVRVILVHMLYSMLFLAQLRRYV